MGNWHKTERSAEENQHLTKIPHERPRPWMKSRMERQPEAAGKVLSVWSFILLTILEIPQNILRKPSSWRQVIMGMITRFHWLKKKKILPNKNVRDSYLCMEDLILFLSRSYISSLWHSFPSFHFSRISPSLSPPLRSIPSSASPQPRAGLPATSVKHDIRANNKPRHIS